MISRYEYEGVTWVDMENPTAEEVSDIAQEFSLGSLLPQELLTPSLKPRVDLYPEFTYTVLHFPALRHTRGMSPTQEVDIVMGKNFFLTVHYETISAIYDFERSFEAAMLLKRATGGTFHTGHILLELSERLYQSVENELEALEDSVTMIEHKIFSGHEREMVIGISSASRELLNQKRVLSTHKEVLESSEQVGISLFGEDFGNYFRAVSAFHFRVYSHAIALADTIAELRDTNNALLSTRQNEIMKNLTVMTFVTAPLAVVTGIFGMSLRSIPLADNPNAFWIVLGIMAILFSLLVTYFKKKKWF
ncbi:magnesium transporter CorA family protein [Candidatus Kaiserbacteria bacterium]|nr:magnesium transporter CorA family protein [Candidatus Kaiserbacteria bacterium]